MTIKKQLFISILSLGLMAQGMNAHAALRRITTLVKPQQMHYANKIRNQRLSSSLNKQLVKKTSPIAQPSFRQKIALKRTQFSEKKATILQELVKPFERDINVFQASSPSLQKNILEPLQKTFTELVQNKTTRQLIALKVGEYAATAPGMFLAASGNYGLAGAISVDLLARGHWGALTSTALVTGAASYYALEKGKELLEENFTTPDITLDNTVGANTYGI